MDRHKCSSSLDLTSRPPGKQKDRRSFSLRGNCFSGGYTNKTWKEFHDTNMLEDKNNNETVINESCTGHNGYTV